MVYIIAHIAKHITTFKINVYSTNIVFIKLNLYSVCVRLCVQRVYVLGITES